MTLFCVVVGFRGRTCYGVLGRGMRVFLSYSSKDRARAEEIALALEGAGHDVFFDRTDLEGGDDFHSVIRDRLRASDRFIFLITPASVREGAYTLTELRMAREKWSHPKGHVVPVMLEQTPLSDVPAYLRGVTILEPEGNVAAEVAAELERHRRRRRRRRFLAAGGLALSAIAIAGLLLAAAFHFFDSSDEPTWPVAESEFVTHYVYRPDDVQRVEYLLDPTHELAAAGEGLLSLERVAFGELARGEPAFGIAVVLTNASERPIQIDVSERFFTLEDDQGRSATLVFFCCRSKRGELLAAGERREIRLLFQPPPGWTGKETRAHSIYLKVRGLLPIARATWTFAPLPTAA